MSSSRSRGRCSAGVRIVIFAGIATVLLTIASNHNYFVRTVSEEEARNIAIRSFQRLCENTGADCSKFEIVAVENLVGDRRYRTLAYAFTFGHVSDPLQDACILVYRKGGTEASISRNFGTIRRRER